MQVSIGAPKVVSLARPNVLPTLAGRGGKIKDVVDSDIGGAVIGGMGGYMIGSSWGGILGSTGAVVLGVAGGLYGGKWGYQLKAVTAGTIAACTVVGGIVGQHLLGSIGGIAGNIGGWYGGAKLANWIHQKID